jgi:hypothetical protein
MVSYRKGFRLKSLKPVTVPTENGKIYIAVLGQRQTVYKGYRVQEIRIKC